MIRVISTDSESSQTDVADDNTEEDIFPIEPEDLVCIFIFKSHSSIGSTLISLLQENLHNELFDDQLDLSKLDADDVAFNEPETASTSEWQPQLKAVLDPRADQDQAFVLFSQISAEHYAGKTLQMDLWNRFYRRVSDDAKRFEANRSSMEKDYPKVSLDIILKEKATGELKMFTATKFPRKRYRRNEYQPLSIYYHCNISDVANFHARIHKDDERKAILSKLREKSLLFNLGIDGVPHSKSGSKKMTLLSVQFDGCKLIYNSGVYIRASNYSVTAPALLQRFVNEAKKEDFPLRLNHLVMDLVMKCYVLNIKQFNGSYGNTCQRCRSRL